jgi:hypothetical protein
VSAVLVGAVVRQVVADPQGGWSEGAIERTIKINFREDAT